LADQKGYFFTWLIVVLSLLGHIGGIMIVDYYFIRKKELAVDELYQHNGRYKFSKGFNPVAIIALLAGILPNVPGFLLQIKVVSAGAMPQWINGLYHYAWFVGFFVSGVVYWVLTKGKAER